MYYKVIKNNKVIDVLDQLIYLKWQHKHQIMILAEAEDAQAILSSDKNTIWHVDGWYLVPVDGYDTIELEEIDIYEYERLKRQCLMTYEEILDEYTLSLLEGGIL